MSDAPIPLWKQCLGAVVGAAAALVIYGGFTLVMDQLPSIGAVVTSALPTEQTAEAVSSAPTNVQDIVRRAREIAARNLAKESGQTVVESDTEADTAADDTEMDVTEKQDASAVSYKVLPVAANVVASSSSSKGAQPSVKSAASDATHAGAPVKATTTKSDLPSTGVGLWAGALVAMAGASLWHRKALASHLRGLNA